MAARCWYCDREIVAPVEIIGRWLAGTSRIVHKACIVALLDLEAEFQQPDGEAAR